MARPPLQKVGLVDAAPGDWDPGPHRQPFRIVGPVVNQGFAVTEPTNGTRYRLEGLERRMDAVEGQNIAVLADRVNRLNALVGWMIAAFVTFILSTLGGLIVFLLAWGSS